LKCGNEFTSNGVPLLYPADDSATHLFAVRGGYLLESTDQGRHWLNMTPSFIEADFEDAITSITDPRHGPIFFSSYSGVYLLE
jgi:hypothetical protein